MLRVAYTRTGKTLHLIDVEEGERRGATLCGRYGYAHPDFAQSTDGLARMSLSFNFGCKTCTTKADDEREV